ncbi:MAG: hybrid sensor histidine kinase/response regulator [Planctomycetota bacterium]|jgi:signal transduction histidine kinase
MDYSKLKIVFADDDSSLRKITAKNLTNSGYEVFEAENGEQAVQKTLSEKPEIAILDIMMPKMSGTEACRQIRTNEPTKNTYIIFLTAKDNISDIINGFDEQKADDYITKPFNMNELIARVGAGARIKQLQNELNEKNLKLKELLAEQAKFLGLAAHDLRSPLSIINTYLSLLGQDVISSDEIKETCLRRSDGMMQLIDDVLGITKIHSGTVDYSPLRADLNKIIVNASDLYGPVADNENINITVNVPSTPSYCICDPKRISEIMENLISNAIKYSSESSTISIDVIQENSNIIVTVEDEGEGILPENFEKIFEPFAPIENTLEKQVPHTSLGLAIVKKLVELHGGKIEVSSKGLKQGSTFKITLSAVK